MKPTFCPEKATFGHFGPGCRSVSRFGNLIWSSAWVEIRFLFVLVRHLRAQRSCIASRSRMHCIALVLSLSASLVTASSTGPHRLHVSHLAGLYSYGAFGKSPTQSFYSSDATPPALNILTPLDARRYRNATGPTLYTFTGARGDDTAQPAPYIFDDSGELVWQGPLGGVLNSRFVKERALSMSASRRLGLTRPHRPQKAHLQRARCHCYVPRHRGVRRLWSWTVADLW